MSVLGAEHRSCVREANALPLSHLSSPTPHLLSNRVLYDLVRAVKQEKDTEHLQIGKGDDVVSLFTNIEI